MPPTIEIALLRLYGECSAALIVGETYHVTIGGCMLQLAVRPLSDAPPAPESPCEEDVLACVHALIACHGRRVTSKEVFAELEATDQIWGRSTVLNALAALVHKGLLVNPHDKKGYGLPQPNAANSEQSPHAS